MYEGIALDRGGPSNLSIYPDHVQDKPPANKFPAKFRANTLYPIP